MVNRRSFIRQSSALAGGVLLGTNAFAHYQPNPQLSFSTLGCPKWTLRQILEFGVKNGYNGIEIRGILGEMDLTKREEFNTPSAIAATKKQFSEKGLKIVNLGSSAEMHHSDLAKRQLQLDSAKQFIDLAAGIGLPIYPGIPKCISEGPGEA